MEMEIEYDNTIDDIVALNLWHSLNTKTFQKTIKMARTLLPFGVLVLLALVSVVTKSNYYIVAGVFATIALFFWIPKIMYKSGENSVRKIISETPEKGVVGKLKLRITPEQLIESSESGETTQSWDTIDQIIETENHVFVFGGLARSYIIPKRDLPKEMISKFITIASEYHHKLA